MPPPLPDAPSPAPARGWSRRLLPALAALAALATAAPRAAAIGLELSAPREAQGYVWVDARLDHLFDARVSESLSRGMPATLVLDAELWRRRTAWFDRLENSFGASVRVRYDVWTESFLVERTGLPALSIPTLDSLQVVLSRPLALPVARVGQLQVRQRYYVSVAATLKPLSVEDVREVEGWLSGEVEDKRRSGFGVITALPQSVFDAVRNFSGFGDQRVRTQTGDFTLEVLFPSP